MSSEPRVAFGLTFPRGVRPEQAVAAVRALAGLTPPWWRRLFGGPMVSVEVRARAGRIDHVLTMPASRADYVLAAFRAAVPGLRVAAAEGPSVTMSLARELRRRGPGQLRTDAVEASNTGVLAALQPLGRGERAVAQFVIAPLGPRLLPSLRSLAVRLADVPEADEPPIEPEFAVALRVGVRAAEATRCRQLAARVLGSFHAVTAPEGRLVRRFLPSWFVAWRLGVSGRPDGGAAVLAADELAALAGFPINGPQLPGLTLAGGRELPTQASVPRAGLVLGDSTVAGARRPVAIASDEARRGLHICAPTGGGKTTVLANLAGQVMAAGQGLVAIDSKGDLGDLIAERVPAHRRADVLVFDSADPVPMGFNLIGGSEESELVVDHVVGQLRARYGAAGLGPRSEDIARSALLTLATQPGMTLCEVEPLLTNAAFRQRLVGRLDEPVLEGFWGWYGGLSDAARAEAVAPLANKIRSYTLRRRLRTVIGQSTGLDLADALAQGRIVIASLRKGLIGEDAAGLIGAAMTARLWAAIQGRAALPADQRRPVTVICDEFQDFAALSPSFGDAVAQSRGYAAGWVLAHQHLAQLDTRTRQAVLANCRSRLVMQTTAADAAAFAREFAPCSRRPISRASGPTRATWPSRRERRSLPPPASAPDRWRHRSARPRRSALPPALATDRVRLRSTRRSAPEQPDRAGAHPSAGGGGQRERSLRPSFRVAEEAPDPQAAPGTRPGFGNDSPPQERKEVVRGRYVTAGRLAQLEAGVSARDRAIVETLDRLRVATTRQLARLHFADLTRASAARQAPRTLRRLQALRVVRCLDRRLGGVRAGSRAAIWALDTAGQRLASASGPAGGAHPRRPWTPGLAFLAHRLAVSECYVGLVEATHSGPAELLEFTTEPACWRRFASPYGGTGWLKPDAFIRVALGDYECGAFLELDRDTESAPTLGRKLATYRRYWESGREQARRGYFPHVVVAVPDEARKAVAVELCGRQPAEAWPLFRVVVHGELVGSLLGEGPR